MTSNTIWFSLSKAVLHWTAMKLQVLSNTAVHMLEPNHNLTPSCRYDGWNRTRWMTLLQHWKVHGTSVACKMPLGSSQATDLFRLFNWSCQRSRYKDRMPVEGPVYSVHVSSHRCFFCMLCPSLSSFALLSVFVPPHEFLYFLFWSLP